MECVFQQLSDTQWMHEKGIHDPLIQKLPKMSGTFMFIPPTEVKCVGSYSSGTTTMQNPTVDVMLTLPKVLSSVYVDKV